MVLAAFTEGHVHHDASALALLRAEKKHASCAVHSLAEFYSALTRMPGRYRARHEEGILFLEELKRRLTFVALDAEEYLSALVGFAEQGIVGGRMYDALLAQCAMKARAEIILTWNVAHFRSLGPEIARRVQTP